MGHRRGMRSERLRTTQAHRELDDLKPIQDGAIGGRKCKTLPENQAVVEQRRTLAGPQKMIDMCSTAGDPMVGRLSAGGDSQERTRL